MLREVERICAAMDASDYSYELLAIDDASTDETLARAARGRSRASRTCGSCRSGRNGGSGTVRRIGTQRGAGRDRRVDRRRHDLPERAHPRAGPAARRRPDVSTRWSGRGPARRARTRSLRVPAKWLIRKIAEWLTNQQIPDLNSGLRAFRREVALPYLRLLPPGFSCVTTITLAFLSNQHDIRYVPIDYAKRAGHVEVPLRHRRLPLHPAGAADGDVLQPAQGPDAARVVAARRSASSRGSSTWSCTRSASRPTPC